ncbi:hypothetical protein LSM04_002320 [Trypanosoma melophagium]|uniref:uncharacterized protein n=1 Tax=Trypanosoma melophagium TaxID=715481 RepID=UPI00351A29A4|nr:hypothetical protein LSM04_002320 [Trypanosoma melophagium]
MDTSEVVILPSNDGVPFSVELRWRIQPYEIDGLWRLHDASFPVKYDDDYYKWLLSDSCVAIVAYANEMQLASIFSSMESDCKMENGITTEVDNDNDDGTHDVSNGDSSNSYSVVVGFCIGQVAHCRRRDGQIVPSPTGYLGSFAVDARLRCRGIGELLLRRFISYMLFYIPVPRYLFLDSPEGMSSTSMTTTGTRTMMETGLMTLLMSRLENIILYIFGYPFDREKRKYSEEKKEEAVSRDTECNRKDSLPSLISNENQYGLNEVWLHCLAENTKLLEYYYKRGFRRVMVKPQFYTFDGETHDGMLLVCSRENIRDSTSTTSTTGTVLESTGGISCFGMNSAGSLTEAKARRWFISDSEEGNSSDVHRGSFLSPKSSFDSDKDIVDVDITDYSELRAEWCANVADVIAQSNSLLFSSQSTMYVMKIVLVLFGIMWIVSLGR